MEHREFSVPAVGGALGGWTAGEGPRVLVLHGGPGLNQSYLEPLVDELTDGYTVALYQQRGLVPSTQEGPFTVEQAVLDIAAVLDGIGWDRAYLLGHSWGGHLALHAAAALPDRLVGVLSVDPIGGVGDGGLAHFQAEMPGRMPEEVRARAEELEDLDTAGTITDEQLDELRDLAWPSYFASPEDATPRPALWSSRAASDGLWADLIARLPELEESLPTISVPVGVLAQRGVRSRRAKRHRQPSSGSRARGCSSSAVSATSSGWNAPGRSGGRWTGWHGAPRQPERIGVWPPTPSCSLPASASRTACVAR